MKRLSLNSVLSLLCPACEMPCDSNGLCSVCYSFLSPVSDQCPCCCMPSVDQQLCGKCIIDPPLWDALHVGWQFEGLTRFLIHQFKYQRDLSCGQALITLWMQRYQTLEKPDAIIAVPMHHTRHHAKGFNQADWLAKAISQSWQIPIFKHLLRAQLTPTLEGLTKKERKKVLHNAFALRQQPPKSVAIVDDVFTSGATAHEMSRTLKRQGCENIQIWTLARTLMSPGN